MRTQWNGHYLDGRTAEGVQAVVRLTPEVITISAGGLSLVWPYAEARQTGGFYDGEHVRIEKGGAALVVKDAGFLRAVRQIAPAHARRFHDPDGRKKRKLWIPAAAVGAVVTAAVLYLWGIPLAATFMAEKIPPGWEAELGRRTLPALTTGLVRCEDTGLNGHVEAMVERLGGGSLPYDMEVHILQSDGVNAFALPGGSIVLLTGLVERTETPEELAGVLAHEMQHVIQRHSTKSVIEGMTTAMLFRFVTGQGGGFIKNLGGLRYSRIHEKEADMAGVELLAASGIDPAPLAGFFERISKGQEGLPGVLGYVSSHPMADERVKYLEEKTSGTAAGPRPLLPGVDWKKAREDCGTGTETD